MKFYKNIFNNKEYYYKLDFFKSYNFKKIDYSNVLSYCYYNKFNKHYNFRFNIKTYNRLNKSNKNKTLYTFIKPAGIYNDIKKVIQYEI